MTARRRDQIVQQAQVAAIVLLGCVIWVVVPLGFLWLVLEVCCP